MGLPDYAAEGNVVPAQRDAGQAPPKPLLTWRVRGSAIDRRGVRETGIGGMNGWIALALKGAALGAGAAVPIGPVNVEIARRTLRGGFSAGFALGCGAVTVDMTYLILTSVSIRPVLSYPWVYRTAGVCGIALLAYLGIMSLRSAWRAARHREQMGGDLLQDSPKRPSVHGGYLTGLLMTLSNPMTLIFWFAVVPAQMGQITDKPAHDLPAVCVGVFLATLGWVIAFAGAVSVAGRFRRNWWLVVADAAGGAALVALAIITAFAFAASPSIMAAHH